MAVTLEPCGFVGQTGACTEAIFEAGLSRIVVGCRDPHPKVSGRGIQKLRRRGLKVTTGVLKAECLIQHRGFISVCERGRPYVTLKLATSLDGRIALANGESRWITSPESREFVHRLRDENDAVMVGSGTARADDPELNVRRGDRIARTPVRLLVDGGNRVSPSSRLFDCDRGGETWVLCRKGARGLQRTRAKASRVLEISHSDDGFIDLPRAFQRLGKEGLTSVLVEGGGRLAAALLRANLVDEVHWMLAPTLIGGDGRAGLGALELSLLADAISIDPIRVVRRGPDLHVHGRIRGTRGSRA